MLVCIWKNDGNNNYLYSQLVININHLMEEEKKEKGTRTNENMLRISKIQVDTLINDT